MKTRCSISDDDWLISSQAATAIIRATADAWATACEEDLIAEKARRRARYGPPPGSAAEELRKLVDTVADKLPAGVPRHVADPVFEGLLETAARLVQP